MGSSITTYHLSVLKDYTRIVCLLTHARCTHVLACLRACEAFVRVRVGTSCALRVLRPRYVHRQDA
eukprot:6200333-Pleurochrysis_carterae.AAC.2